MQILLQLIDLDLLELNFLNQLEDQISFLILLPVLLFNLLFLLRMAIRATPVCYFGLSIRLTGVNLSGDICDVLEN